MSIPFPQDTSVQLTYSSFPFPTPLLDNYTTSNYVSNISNLLVNNINTKQNILTAATNLLGVGSAITDIDYNKITINKPTNFQSDWNSTVVNKPPTFPADMTNIYNKGETNTLLNAKQNTLTAATNLLGIGSSITNINYATLSNVPSTFPANMSNIYNKTETDALVNSAWTKSGINIYNTGSSGKVGINTTIPQGALEVVGYLNSSWKVKFGTSLSNGVNYAANRIYCNSLIRFLTTWNTDEIATFHRIDNYDDPINATEYFSVKTTGINVNGTCTATTFSGNGASLTNIPYASITGLPATFPADMTNIYTKTETNNLLNAKEATLTFNSPLTRTTNTIGLNQSLISYNNLADRPTIYTQSQTDTLLNAKQNTLTAATTLLGIGSSITNISYGNITGLPATFPADMTNIYTKTETNTLLNAKQNTLTAATTLLGIGSSITNINYATLSNVPSTFPADMTNIYTKTETNTLLNAKEATLTFSSPLIRTTNTISLNQSLISYNNLADRPDLNLYLLKSGGTMTGQLQLSTATGDNPIYITSTNTTANNAIQIKNNSTFNAYIGIGGTALTGNYANNLFIESASSSIIFNTNGRTSASTPNMIVHSTGNVGIGTTNPGTNKLNVNGTTFLGGNTNINGIANIHNGNPVAVAYNYMASGSLTIGGSNVNYGGGNLWNANTAGLLMECADNTEIAVHDNALRVASFMYYEGGANHKITIGRDMGWGGISSVNIPVGTLNFGSRISNFIINLWSTNEYGFGINGGMLRYNSMGRHTFFSNGAEKIDFSSTGVISCAGINNSGSITSSTITTTAGIGAGDRISTTRYECIGVLYSYSTLINSAGQSRDGYFIPIPINNYGNSIILCAFSHNSTSYTYWRGHVSVGNSNNILNVSAPISGSQLLVESFIQNTGTHFIRVVPTVSYNTGVQLRAKMYG